MLCFAIYIREKENQNRFLGDYKERLSLKELGTLQSMKVS